MFTSRTSRVLTAALCLSLFAAGAVFATGAEEEAYPSRPITVIVPWSPGGVSDSRARIIAEYMEESLGQPLVIQNIGGASGTVGTEEGLAAEADGYTIISVDDATWYGIHSGIGDYTLDDFAPIAMIGKWPLVIAGRADAAFTDFGEFVEAALASPGELAFAITAGNQSHLVPVEISAATGAEFNLVAPQGDVSRNAALLAGNVDAAITYVSSGMQYVESGDFVFLAHTFPERHPQIPDVPTLDELGIGMVYEMWGGFAAPAGTPADRIAILEAAIEEAATNPELIRRLDELTIDTEFKGTEETESYLIDVNERIEEFAQVLAN
jgi:tripartite-type tricarboxylate transporter receptor subunit TctC